MLTILTPAYNRGYILPQAFASLCRQTCKDFEWILVDDGSGDDTRALVSRWQEEPAGFPITYVYQENGGKHRAVNRGVALAKGEYVLILDSDDYLTDDAVEQIHAWVQTIAGLEGFAGVSGLRGWQDRDDAIGGRIGKAYVDATNIQRKQYGLLGDKAEVYKTQILRRYPFPEFEGENFLRESAVWDAIALDGYRIRWFDRVIYRCEYLEDGLTKGTTTQRDVRNFQGYVYCGRLAMKTLQFPYKEYWIGRFYETAKQAGQTNRQICRLLNISWIRLLVGRGIYGARNRWKRRKRL